MSEKRSKHMLYTKSMPVPEDYRTGELRGYPETIAQIRREFREMGEKAPVTACSFASVPAFCGEYLERTNDR